MVCPRIDGWDHFKSEQLLSFFGIFYLFGHLFKVGAYEKETQHCQNCCHCTKWQQSGGRSGKGLGVRRSRVVWSARWWWRFSSGGETTRPLSFVTIVRLAIRFDSRVFPIHVSKLHTQYPMGRVFQYWVGSGIGKSTG